MSIKQITLIEMNINEINEADYNPRKKLKAGDKAYERLKQSILTFGYIDPLIYNIRTQRLVGGHQRLQILKDLGEEKVQVSMVDLSEIDEKDLNIRLNKISGEFDPDSLAAVVQELEEAGVQYEDLGFDDQEFQDLINQMEQEERSNTALLDAMIEETEEQIDREHQLNDSYTNEKPDRTGNSDREPLPFDDIEDEEDNESYTPSTSEEDDEEDEQEEYFNLGFPVTYEQRNTINQAIRQAKKDYEVTTSTEALLQICIRYMNKQ